MASARRLAVTVRPVTGGTYEIYVHADERENGRWDGRLEFRPLPAGESLFTRTQTTQRTESAVFEWAAGLTNAHIEHALATIGVERHPSPARISVASTPARSRDRLEHLRPVERDVLSMFAERRTVSMLTREVFDAGPYANSDFVRAFEDLQKSYRYLVRHTIGGNDLIELTAQGAEAIGLFGDEKSAGEDTRAPQVS